MSICNMKGTQQKTKSYTKTIIVQSSLAKNCIVKNDWWYSGGLLQNDVQTKECEKISLT